MTLFPRYKGYNFKYKDCGWVQFTNTGSEEAEESIIIYQMDRYFV